MNKHITAFVIAIVSLSCAVQAQWEKVPGPEIPTIGTFIETGGYLFAAAEGMENNCMVYRSTNDGRNWVQSSRGLIGSENLGFVNVGETLYLLTDIGLFKSENLGTSWSPLPVPSYKYITRIVADNSSIYICGVPVDSYRYNFYGSQNSGKDWTPWSVISNASFHAAAALDGHVYTCFPTQPTFYDYHPSYSEYKRSISTPGECRDLISEQGSLFAATSTGVYISSDKGRTWPTGGLENVSLKTVSLNGDFMAALSTENTVYTSVEGTHIWKELPSTFSPGPGEGLEPIAVCATSSGTILVSVEGAGLYRWDEGANTWVNSSSGMSSATSYQIESIGDVIFTTIGTSGIYRSQDNGSTWEPVNTDFTDQRIYSITTHGSYLYAATWQGENWKSTNLGNTWELIGNSTSAYTNPWKFWIHPHMLAYNNGVLHNGCTIGSVRSTDEGMTWTSSTLTPHYMRSHNGTIYYGTDLGIEISTNNGITWRRTEAKSSSGGNCASTGGEMFAFDMEGDVIVGGGVQLFFTTNAGGFWFSQVMPDGDACEEVLEVEHIEGQTFLVSFGSGHIYRTLDNAGTWVDYSQGLPELPRVRDFHRVGDYVYAADEYSGLWRRAIHETTSTDDISQPRNLVLAQNYPNPVYGTTTIRYSLPTTEHVTLTVTNTLGQEVARLVDTRMEAGTDSVPFSTSNLVPGVYLYTLRSGSATITKSMLVSR